MTYPHLDPEQKQTPDEMFQAIMSRFGLVEAAVAKLTREIDDMRRQLGSVSRGGSSQSAASPPNIGEIDKWTLEWISGWTGKGTPIARVASPLECKKIGGQGKGDWDGDPVIKYDPKFWKQESWAGRHYSQCPPDYLDMLAESEEYRAGRGLSDPEKKKWAKYNLRSAALAKGWARMIREDPGVRRATDAMADFASDEIPF